MPRPKSTTAKQASPKQPSSRSPQKRPAAKAPRQKRTYNSPLREQQIVETKERIIAAGVELVRSYESWDWKNLNASAVAKRSQLGKRTVQRYYPTEKVLRDAVLQQLVLESGVQFESLSLRDLGDMIEKIFRYLQSFAQTRAYPFDPSIQSLDQQGRLMLLKAVAEAKPDWPENRQMTAAAALDIFWQPQLLERLMTIWEMDIDQAVDTVTSLVDLIENAMRRNRFPQPD